MPPALRHCLWAMHAHKFAQSAMSEANGELTHVAATNLISYLLPKQRQPPGEKRPRHARHPPSSLRATAPPTCSYMQLAAAAAAGSNRLGLGPAHWPFGQTFVCHRQRGVHFVYILPKNAASSLCSVCLLASLLGRMINSPSSRQAPYSLILSPSSSSSLRVASGQLHFLVNKEYTKMILARMGQGQFCLGN